MNSFLACKNNMNSFYEYKLPYILLSLLLVALLVFLIALFLSLKLTKKIEVSSYELNNNNIVFHIDTINVNHEGAFLEGWILKKNEDINIVNSYFVLYDINSDEYIRFSTKKIGRPDVAKNLNIGYKINNCGIKSYIDMDSLKKEHIYEVCILYGNNNNKIIVKTGKFFNGKGELVNG